MSNNPLGKIDPNGEWDACAHGATCKILDYTGLWTAGQALAADAAYLTAVYTNNVEVQNQVAQELADNKGDLYKTLAGFAAGYGAGKVAAWALDAIAGAGAASGAVGVGKEIGVIRDALSGKGNFGLGSGSRAEAERLGRSWGRWLQVSTPTES